MISRTAALTLDAETRNRQDATKRDAGSRYVVLVLGLVASLRQSIDVYILRLLFFVFMILFGFSIVCNGMR